MKKLDETAIIRIFQQKLNRRFTPEDVEVAKLGTTRVVTKVDTLVQSTDIPLQMSMKDAARKSVVACISDFAAKGVKPELGIISINLPKTVSYSTVNQIARGFKIASEEFQIKIIGGDTNEGKEFVFTVCIFGKANKITPRKGADEGDIIFVTGPFGYTASGLKILLERAQAKNKFIKKATRTVFKPIPRLEWGLRYKNYFSSSMDSSDGLSTTLNEMAEQSNKKFIIDNIPVNKDLYEFVNKNKIELIDLVFHGGEEYEFVFTVPEKNKSRIKKFALQTNTPIIEIGHVEKGKGVFFKHNGKIVSLRDLGWHHFK